jgi:hypothetical protein
MDLQLDALDEAGCAKIFTDKLSGAKDNRRKTIGLAWKMPSSTHGPEIHVWFDVLPWK